MKQTIAISAFAGMLARQSGYTVEFCEQFVIEMFKTIADALKESDKVTVKGLGTFAVDETGNVAFTPDAAFAADVNAPFDCFEPELLDDDVTDEILSDNIADDSTDSDETEADEEIKETEPEDVDEIAEENSEKESKEEAVAESVAETTELIVEKTPEDVVEENVAQVSDAEPDVIASETQADGLGNSYETEDLTERPRRRHVWVFLCGVALGAIAGAAATYLILSTSPSKESAEQVADREAMVANDLGEAIPQTDNEGAVGDSIAATDTVAAVDSESISTVADTAEKVPAEPEPIKEAPKPVYDTVKTTLSQLSRKHYGGYEFWVYIYDENRDIIDDPNKVETGTRVRIPAPEKYGIDARDKASIRKAKQRASEIAREPSK